MLERRGLAGRLSGYRGGHLDSDSGGDHRGKCRGAETPVALLRQATDTDDVFHDVPSRNSALGRRHPAGSLRWRTGRNWRPPSPVEYSAGGGATVPAEYDDEEPRPRAPTQEFRTTHLDARARVRGSSEGLPGWSLRPRRGDRPGSRRVRLSGR